MDERKKNDLIIEELRKRRSRETTVDVEVELVKIVIFMLQDGLYALPGADVKEILPSMDISPVPGAPAFIPGVINNRGDIESVINLNEFLGLPDSERTAASRIAMVSKAALRTGILVDAVLDVVDVPLNSVKPPLSTLENALKELVTGEIFYNNRTVVMLDIDRLLEKLATQDV